MPASSPPGFFSRSHDPALVHDVATLRHGADHLEIPLNHGLAIEIDNGAGGVLHDRRLDAFRGLPRNSAG
jgi:hypothetical protein